MTQQHHAPGPKASKCSLPHCNSVKVVGGCHDPSHGGSYVAEGAFYIRIGLLPRIVSGDRLALSRLRTDCLHCYRAHPMSHDWGCTSMSYRSLHVPVSSMRP